MTSPLANIQLSPRESRVIGALLGVHAGDSLGATVEFSLPKAIARKYPNGLRDIVGGGPFRWPAGHATDDTDMTRGVLLAYHDRYYRGIEQDIARLAGDHFVDWLDGHWPEREKGSGPEDIGSTTRIGLDLYKTTRDPDNAGGGQGGAGNGSLMRCIATGLFQTDPEKNTIVSKLIDQVPVQEAIKAGLAVAEKLEGEQGVVYEAIQLGQELDIARMAHEGPSPRLRGRCSGYVLESLSLAIAAILDQRSLEDIVVDVVSIGSDTDTNAAIAGGLLGARDGAEAIPPRWRSLLQFGDEFEMKALELLRPTQN